MFYIITQYLLIFYLGGYLAFLVLEALYLRPSLECLVIAIFWPLFILNIEGLFENEEPHERRATLHYITSFTLSIFVGCVSAYGYHELTLSPEDELAREKALLAEEKRELEEEHAQALVEAQERIKEAEKRRVQEIKEARIQVEIAKVQAERAKLRDQAIPKEIADQIAQANKRLEQLDSQRGSNELAQANAELARLRTEGVDYSKLSQPKMSSASPSKSREPGAPVDEQRRLVLSGLWLGACFFLQRVFEKLFKDKGYALLTVCAAGFLLAFFTANYFLLGGSVTGGLMGAAGDRT